MRYLTRKMFFGLKYDELKNHIEINKKSIKTEKINIHFFKINYKEIERYFQVISINDNEIVIDSGLVRITITNKNN